LEYLAPVRGELADRKSLPNDVSMPNEALIYAIENSPTVVGAIGATLMMVSQADYYQPLTLFA
jgi:hypothetical protein